MSKKFWIGALVVAGLAALGNSGSNKSSHAAHAVPVRTVTYKGPALMRTNWYWQTDHDPMTGKNIYSALLKSGGEGDTKANLLFRCAGNADLTMLIENQDFTSQDHIFFDAKVGDSDTFQVFGEKIGTNQMGTDFMLEEDLLEDWIKDGVPIYLRYTIGNNVSTISFVPNLSEAALAPVRLCKHE